MLPVQTEPEPLRSFAIRDLDRDQIYRLLSGLVVPRPIAWISTLSPTGIPNLAPFSFFTVVGSEPPLLGVSINNRKARGPKDTLVNIEATGDFVINIASAAMVDEVECSGTDVAPEIDEFQLAGLQALHDTRLAKAPRVAGAPAWFECVHHRTVDFGEYAFVVGEVLAVSIDSGLCTETLRVDYQAFDWLGRLAGGLYCADARLFRPGRSGPVES